MAPPVNEDVAALRAAVLLMSLPSRRRMLRNAPFPTGMDVLLHVAGDVAAAETLAKGLTKSPQELQEAAGFFIEQILLAPNTDSYRTLGASRRTAAPQLRQNFVHLRKWLHSDGRPNIARSAYLLRITQAWNNIKTPERRSAYDLSIDARLASRGADHVAPGEQIKRPKRSNRRRVTEGDGFGETRSETAFSRKRRRRSVWGWVMAFAQGSWS